MLLALVMIGSRQLLQHAKWYERLLQVHNRVSARWLVMERSQKGNAGLRQTPRLVTEMTA